MTVDLDFWWLIFPLFGTVAAVIACAHENSREDAILRDPTARMERDQ